jgi:predicted ATPase
MPDFHILTGPPGRCWQRRVDGQGAGDRDPALFVALMLDQAIRDHDAALSAPGPVVFDRGLADLLVLCRLLAARQRLH